MCICANVKTEATSLKTPDFQLVLRKWGDVVREGHFLPGLKTAVLPWHLPWSPCFLHIFTVCLAPEASESTVPAARAGEVCGQARLMYRPQLDSRAKGPEVSLTLPRLNPPCLGQDPKCTGLQQGHFLAGLRWGDHFWSLGDSPEGQSAHREGGTVSWALRHASGLNNGPRRHHILVPRTHNCG